MQFKTKTVPEANVAIAGTQFENQEAKALVVDFARDPMKAYAFNIASMAFNNHFFFRGINANPDVQSRPSTDLTKQINRDFSSMETLRETFLATAESMFGPGFVWLVQTNDTSFGSLRILPTYLAGSPLSGAHHRRQSHDLNTHNVDSYQGMNKVGSFGAASQQQRQSKAGRRGADGGREKVLRIAQKMDVSLGAGVEILSAAVSEALEGSGRPLVTEVAGDSGAQLADAHAGAEQSEARRG